MPEVEITVRGSSTAYAMPERATVRVRVGSDGAEANAVHRDVGIVAQRVRESIEPLHDPEEGPVIRWASDQVRTWSERARNRDGDRLPVVHHAEVLFEVTLIDFTELAMWVAETAEHHGVSVEGIDWALTDEQHRMLIAEVRAEAVDDAAAKAATYAGALGLEHVVPVAVADAGMLGTGSSEHREPSASEVFGATADALQLSPRLVAITADVDARFLAGWPPPASGGRADMPPA